MAYRLVTGLLDIEFPDGTVDDEAATPPEGISATLATPINEIIKIIRDGAAVEGFDVEAILHSSATQVGGNGVDITFDLVKQ